VSGTKPAEKVDAWMPLWIGAYLADTMNLSRDSHGGYLLLLFAYWRNKGPLPDDDEDLRNITKATAPGEWAKLRPRLAKFFTIVDGHWAHGRADEELVKAGEFKAAASAKGKAGAEARWGKGRSKGTGTAKANATGLPQALPEQSTTPPPPPPTVEEPIGSSPAAGGDDEPLVVVTSTSAGLICRSLRQAGFSNVSPSHPGLLALLDAGATEGEFLAFADQALGKRDPFAYLLTVVQSQRVQAAQMAGQMHRGALPNRQEALEQRNRAVGDQWLAEQEDFHATQ
jgi:uncharacterized protein YdaU (DUF1376 family)